MLQALPELPAQPAGPGSFPHQTPQALRAWCEALPGSEPELGIRQLGDAVNTLNATALRPGLRASLLEILEDHLLPLLPALERLLRQRPLPLGDRSRERAESHSTVLHALVQAELLVVRERIDTVDARHRERVAPHLQAAVTLLAALSVHYWRLYQPMPSGHWQQLFDLLRLARSQGLANEAAATQKRLGPLSVDTIESVVARLMVLSNTDTNALKMGEIDILAHWIDKLPMQCRAAPDPTQHPELPVLRCDLDRDHAPGLVLRSSPPTDSACFVELAPVLEELREHPDRLEPGTHQDASPLAEHLLRLWSHLPTRRHSRERTQDQQRVCVLGLERIHGFLLADMETQRQEREAPTEGDPDEGRPQSLQQRDRGVSVFAMSQAALRGSDLALADSPQSTGRTQDLRPLMDDTPSGSATAWEDVSRGLEISSRNDPQGPITKRHPPEHWRVDDVGAGGVRLNLDAPQQPLLIGDLVGLRAVDGHRWTVGVLRWIRYDDAPDNDSGARISIGVEHLANRCLPMQIQDYRNGIAAGVPHPGLFAPQRTDAEGAALFLPAQVFDHEKHVVCWLNGRARVLELDNERTGTTLFTEVGCRMTALEVTKPPDEDFGVNNGPALENDDGPPFTTRNRDDQAP
ncbi:hypothetical protein [Thioalkalivibrio sp. ALJ7]|uniref:hypothetical protein n=1 Tax=Thioalkalivibrio sp. ALJ7 TaxID=1158756 RepID=UPI00036A58C3|nr:hypothetical protein [Thioalkalivibrio sp. ALJ7]